jgi:hypothetical protein
MYLARSFPFTNLQASPFYQLINTRGTYNIIVYIINNGLLFILLFQLILIDFIIYLILFEPVIGERSNYRGWISVRVGSIFFYYRRCRLTKLLPYLAVFEYKFDIASDLIMASLGLNNRQPPGPIGLGFQQHDTTFHRCRHNETVLD